LSYEGTRPSQCLERAALVAIVLVAACLRFYGIDHDLRRSGANFDEAHNFVSPIMRMWNEGSLDPLVYSGYAGAFNYLAFLPVIIGHALGGEYGAFLAGRIVVAAFGTAAVVLIFSLARNAFGPTPALLAAALLTFSRLDVRSAHYIIPDVLVGFAALALLLIANQARPGRRAALGCGVATGLATAVKYSGVILGPAGFMALLARREMRRGLAIFLGCALLAFAITAPYAVLGTSDQGAGVHEAIKHYYGSSASTNKFLRGAGSSLAGALGLMRLSLGWPVLLLAAVGAFIGRPRVVTLPATALVVTLLLSIAPANLLFPRHVIPALAPAIVLAVAALHRPIARGAALRTRRALWLAAAVVVLWQPLPNALAFFSEYFATPGPDQAAAWIESTFKRPLTVLSAAPYRFPLDTDRFEVVHVDVPEAVSEQAIPYFELVVVSPAERGQAFTRRWGWPARYFEEPFGPRSVIVYTRPETPPVDREAPRPNSFRTSISDDDAPLVWDGDVETQWRAGEGASIEVAWNAPQRIARVVITAGRHPYAWPQAYRLLGRAGEEDAWDTLAVQWLRPIRPKKQRRDVPNGQELILVPPRDLTALRLQRDQPGAWSVAELRAFVAAQHVGN
jgi:hypothetical protein